MCGLYRLSVTPAAVKAAFGLPEAPDFPPRGIIRPGEPVGVVRRAADGARRWRLALWGLIPQWMKEPPKGRRIINARAETLLERPSFRGLVRHRRCLFPADGFYEWTGERGHKKAWLFARPDGGVFAMAGLWDRWLGADGSEVDTAVIITVDANADVAAVHDRMPALLLDADAVRRWLDPAVPAREAMTLLKPAPGGSLKTLDAGNPLKRPPAQGRLL